MPMPQSHIIPEFAALFDRAEKDMIYDAHSFWLKFGRSKAVKEIVARHSETLPAIIEHVAPKSDSGDVEMMWCVVIDDVVTSYYESKGRGPVLGRGQLNYTNIQAWVEWAKRCTVPQAA